MSTRDICLCCLPILQEKASYKDAFSQLRGLKGEIEHLQLLLEQSRKKLQADFQQWLGMVARQQQAPTPMQDLSKEASTAPEVGADYNVSRSTDNPRQLGRSITIISSSETSSSTELLPVFSRKPGEAPSRPGSSRGFLRKSVSTAGSSTVLHGPGTAGAASRPAAGAGLDLTQVDPKLLQAAAPHLTGNAEADADIIKFFEAKEKLLQMKLGRGGSFSSSAAGHPPAG